MKFIHSTFWKSYSYLILLLFGITVGGLIGVFFRDVVVYLKPVGDIFLNLLFVTVIPLIFFAIVNSVASIEQRGRLQKILSVMGVTFLCFIVLAAIFTLAACYLFPISAPPAELSSEFSEVVQDNSSWSDKIVEFFTTKEFYLLFSRQSMLALLVFSFLLGAAIRKVPEEQVSTLKKFLVGINATMEQMLLLIMKVAPIGLGAYIAYQVGTIGPQLFGFYAKPLGIYYVAGIVYFAVFYSLYAFVGAGRKGMKIFWRYNIIPTFTAVSTCSSLATMPVSIEAAKKMGTPDSISNIVISIGTNIHKNGSSISSIIKIYVVFLMMGWDLFTPMNILAAIGLTIFVSMVEGGIPNGGYIGEILMISVYNLPQEVIPAVMIIGTLVDPLATILNATGSLVASMVVTRFTGDKLQPVES